MKWQGILQILPKWPIVLLVEELTVAIHLQVYGGTSVTAVDHLCLGIPKGECFGLLGINGKERISKATVF